MKIRCKNCYRVLNPNEEYCTACGEHSAAMQKAMITGDYGPDNAGKAGNKMGAGCMGPHGKSRYVSGENRQSLKTG